MADSDIIEKINKRLAEYMGLCYHEAVNNDYATVQCSKCGNGFGGGAWGAAMKRLDYCGSLDLLRPVELKVIEEFGLVVYLEELGGAFETRMPESEQQDLDDAGVIGLLVTADAPTRAQAISQVIGEK